MPPQCWLLQQPRDSGYVEGSEDLFAQAFKSYDTKMQMLDGWLVNAQEVPPLDDTSAASASSSPFEFADSLVLPSHQWQPYRSSFSSSYSLDGSSYDVPTYPPSMLGIPTGMSQQKPMPAQKDFPPRQIALHPGAMEESYPHHPDSSARGRPRQREHHTVVEQRYRKNLNLHFNNLRNAVPDIPTCQPQRAGQPAKPSKCEVLMAAADYIKQLEQEVQAFRTVADSVKNVN